MTAGPDDDAGGPGRRRLWWAAVLLVGLVTVVVARPDLSLHGDSSALPRPTQPPPLPTGGAPTVVTWDTRGDLAADRGFLQAAATRIRRDRPEVSRIFFAGRLPDGALVVNVARGTVVVTDDLLAEVSSGRLLAALDVTEPEPLPPDHPLWSAPGVLISPHVGGDTTAFLPRALRLVEDQLHRYAEGRPLENVITAAY